MNTLLHCGWLFIVFLLAGCGTFAPTIKQITTSTAIAEANLTQTQTTSTPTRTSTPTLEPSSTATERPTATLEPTVTQIPTIESTSTPVPLEELDAFARVIASHDAENGAILFQTFQPEAGFACSTCHRSDSEDRLIGPGLLNVGTRAETRVTGQPALEYIYTSMTSPSEYVVPEYPDELMPANWAEIYSEDEIYDIIAYLLTLE